MGLIYGLSFRIQAAASYFPQSWVKKTVWYYIWRIWRILCFMSTILNIEPYSPLKPTKVGFISIVPNSFGRAEDLAAVKCWRLGLKVGFRKLRLKPKFLNRGLCWLYSNDATSWISKKPCDQKLKSFLIKEKLFSFFTMNSGLLTLFKKVS